MKLVVVPEARLDAAAGLSVPSSTRLLGDRLRDLAVGSCRRRANGYSSASYSGLFKSFFDVIEKDALAGLPVLIAATGGTARHSPVLEHALRPLFAHLRAVVVPTGVYAASEDWGAPGLDGRIERAAGEPAGLMRGLSGVRAAAADDLTVVPFAEQPAALDSPSGA